MRTDESFTYEFYPPLSGEPYIVKLQTRFRQYTTIFDSRIAQKWVLLAGFDARRLKRKVVNEASIVVRTPVKYNEALEWLLLSDGTADLIKRHDLVGIYYRVHGSGRTYDAETVHPNDEIVRGEFGEVVMFNPFGQSLQSRCRRLFTDENFNAVAICFLERAFVENQFVQLLEQDKRCMEPDSFMYELLIPASYLHVSYLKRRN